MEFTKEELQELYCGITGQPGSLSFEYEDIVVLGNKIKSMIDNYCEHNNYEKLYTSCGGVENFSCKDCRCQFINEPIKYNKTVVGVSNE